MKKQSVATLALAAAVLSVGCESQKSSNPLSPSVAGPIPGVGITAPLPLQPTTGATIDVTAQPVTLTLRNSTTSGVRPLSYRFDLAADAGFTTMVYTRQGVAPGSNGRTEFKLPDRLAADRTYYWRAKAEDGANSSDFSAVAIFTVVTPVVLQAPSLVWPINGVTTENIRPTLVLDNAARTGPTGAVTYTFQWATNQTFTQAVGQVDVAETANRTQMTFGADLAAGLRYYWRARAREASRNTTSPWSITQTFLTPAAPTPDPEPPPDPDPTPGGYPHNGPDLVKYIAAKYPSYLAAGVSSDQRKRNLEFLRDRMIETGICGGMDLAWNLKRGGPTLSIDYLTYNKGGRWIGVDFAIDSDNTSVRLRLVWNENPDDPYATPKPYSPRPACK